MSRSLTPKPGIGVPSKEPLPATGHFSQQPAGDSLRRAPQLKMAMPTPRQRCAQGLRASRQPEAARAATCALTPWLARTLPWPPWQEHGRAARPPARHGELCSGVGVGTSPFLEERTQLPFASELNSITRYWLKRQGPQGGLFGTDSGGNTDRYGIL